MKSEFKGRRNLLRAGCTVIAAAALAVVLSFAGSPAFAANAAAAKAPHHKKVVMHTYIIERTIPGAGNLTKAQLRDISKQSNGIIKDMGPQITWVDSYVTQDKVYCIYRAANPDLIREHAKRGGFPADRISEVDTMISPATGK